MITVIEVGKYTFVLSKLFVKVGVSYSVQYFGTSNHLFVVCYYSEMAIYQINAKEKSISINMRSKMANSPHYKIKGEAKIKGAAI